MKVLSEWTRENTMSLKKRTGPGTSGSTSRVVALAAGSNGCRLQK